MGMVAVSGLAIAVFLGGWHASFSFLTWVPSYIWFFTKLLVLIAGFIWVRGTLPRLRMDQLMNFAWKFMLPMALINLLTAGVWHFIPPGPARWLICALLVFGPYVWLGRTLFAQKGIGRRTYSFAECAPGPLNSPAAPTVRTGPTIYDCRVRHPCLSAHRRRYGGDVAAQ